MQDLILTLIQSNLHWENPGANLAMFEEKIWKVGQPTDVIVLPEMFTTGFSMNAKGLSEMMGLQTTHWMKQMATQTGALVLGSFIAREKDKYFNRLVWMEPGGNFKTYDKRHLFRMAEEHTIYTGGTHRLIGTWKGWNICPLVCYDLRFPVWSRNAWLEKEQRMVYDLLIYVANWPEARVLAWDTLLRARAIENGCYAVGVNRTGKDGNDNVYCGHSAIVGPKGDYACFAESADSIHTIKLSADNLQEHRTRFPSHRDADDFKVL